MYKLLFIGLVFFLPGCSLLMEDKKVFQGELQKWNTKEKNGLATFDSPRIELIYVTHNVNNKIKRLDLVQGERQLTISLDPALDKKSVHGSFTLETIETDWDLRIEGQIDRRFLSDPIVSHQEKSCTFSGICEKEIEKEVKECSQVLDVEKCEIKKEIVEERGYYSDCPGAETFTVAEQKTVYDLQLKFFNPYSNQLLANFQGSTDERLEETSRVKTEPCN
jgi:hypothetical protein